MIKEQTMLQHMQTLLRSQQLRLPPPFLKTKLSNIIELANKKLHNEICDITHLISIVKKMRLELQNTNSNLEKNYGSSQVKLLLWNCSSVNQRIRELRIVVARGDNDFILLNEKKTGTGQDRLDKK